MRATDKSVRDRLLAMAIGSTAIVAGYFVERNSGDRWSVAYTPYAPMTLDETLRELGAGEEVAK
jgi:hypothetical protein